MALPEENAYAILGLEQGPAATNAEIKKAYRKLALLKHPDKNPDNPNAANEFSALQRAYDVLTDVEARAALDLLFKARAARVERASKHDDKRRRMAEDLVRRERAAEGRSEEESAAARLRAEVDRMRRAAADREAKQRAAAQKAAAAAASAPSEDGGSAATAAAARVAGVAEALPRTLKVSWARSGGEYASAALRRVFEAHGGVDDVVMREGKKKKGSAVVVMASIEGARNAANSVCGDLKNPVLVVPLGKGDGEESDFAAAGPSGVRPSVKSFVPPQASQPVREGGLAGTNEVPAVSSGRLGPRPAKPLFPAGAQQGAFSSRTAGAGFGSFASFQQPAASAAGSTGGGNAGAAVGFADQRRRQAEERQRLIEQLEREEEEQGQG